MILVSAGFDGHSRDTLAGMSLVEDDYAQMVSSLLGVQSRMLLCAGRRLPPVGAVGESVLSVLRDLIERLSSLQATMQERRRRMSCVSSSSKFQKLHGLYGQAVQLAAVPVAKVVLKSAVVPNPVWRGHPWRCFRGRFEAATGLSQVTSSRCTPRRQADWSRLCQSAIADCGADAQPG